MRGKAVCRHSDGFHLRITPAYAGKSLKLQLTFGIVRDHPRLCGEKGLSVILFNSSSGSPPPMRGKALDSVALFWITRITPAYAGKSGRTLIL